MDLCMSALIFCSLFHNYDPLIITILNGAKNRAILPFNSSCEVDSGRHSHAPLYISYGRTDCLIQNTLITKL